MARRAFPLDLVGVARRVAGLRRRGRAGLRGLFASLVGGLPPVSGVAQRQGRRRARRRRCDHVRAPPGRRGDRPARWSTSMAEVSPCSRPPAPRTAAGRTIGCGRHRRRRRRVPQRRPATPTASVPAGLKFDCAARLRSVIANRSDSPIGPLIVSGESGGGNLPWPRCCGPSATACSARISGAYALCPYISNAWAARRPADDARRERHLLPRRGDDRLAGPRLRPE